MNILNTGSGESENEAPASCFESVTMIRFVGKRCPKCKDPSVADLCIPASSFSKSAVSKLFTYNAYSYRVCLLI